MRAGDIMIPDFRSRDGYTRYQTLLLKCVERIVDRGESQCGHLPRQSPMNLLNCKLRTTVIAQMTQDTDPLVSRSQTMRFKRIVYWIYF